MNTGFCVAAGLGLLWVSVYFFDTLKNNFLGTVAIIAFLGWIPIILWAMREDWKSMTGKG